MKPHIALFLLVFILACATFVIQLLPTAMAAPPTAKIIPPEVLEAIDAVHQAAQRAPDRPAAEVHGRRQETGQDWLSPGIDFPRIIAVGVGMVAGVVAFNLATSSMATAPLLTSAGGMGTSAAAAVVGAPAATVVESSVVGTRIYPIASAVIGGVLADYLYRAIYVDDATPASE